MRLRHIAAMTYARNMEFVRDRGTFFWNMIFPFFLIFGFSFAFSRDGQDLLTVAVFDGDRLALERFLATPGLAQREFVTREPAVERIRNHQLDLLIDGRDGSYLVNPASTSGALVERILTTTAHTATLRRVELDGRAIRYVDWFVPGVIGMNMLFSALFGVGFIIVRYRKNGVLKRLRATPLGAGEFVIAQMLSRLLILLFTSIVVFVGSWMLLDLVVVGSVFNLLLLTVLAIMCFISLGLVFAAWFRSEEVANGCINLALWPMLAFSGVFFSLDSVPPALQRASLALPLTHYLTAARSIMLDGAGLWEIAPNIAVLAGMTAALLTVAALLFRWE